MLGFESLPPTNQKKRKKEEKAKREKREKKENEMKNKIMAWLVTSIICISSLLPRPIQGNVYFNMVSWDGMAEH